MIDSREDIRDFILGIESNFPVDQWTIDNLHIWPIVRIRLFFHLIKKTEYTELKKRKRPINKKLLIFSFFKGKLKFFFSIINYYFFLLFNIPKKKYLFVAKDVHRVDYRGKRFNRFFDVLIEANNIESEALYIESKKRQQNIYNSKRLLDVSKPLRGYLNLKKPFKKPQFIFNCEGYDSFLELLKDHNAMKDFVPLFTVEKITNWYNKNFRYKIQFFDSILKKIDPKQITILCYYSEDIFALLTAANRLKIKTIEMQHGPQTDVHLCYGCWSKVPKEGFDVLPKTYWCWDSASSFVIDKWASKTKIYNSKVVGHPWLNYWQNKNKEYNHKNFVLYCLQPTPLTLETLFPKKILSLIESDENIWFLRLHPRQLKDIQKIIDFFSEKQLSHRVNILDATNDPLPQLLASAKLHITNFSGSTIEATLFGKKTILLHKNGVLSFQHYLESGEAFYINPESENFEEEFRSVENRSNNIAIINESIHSSNLF